MSAVEVRKENEWDGEESFTKSSEEEKKDEVKSQTSASGKKIRAAATSPAGPDSWPPAHGWVHAQYSVEPNCNRIIIGFPRAHIAVYWSKSCHVTSVGE